MNEVIANQKFWNRVAWLICIFIIAIVAYLPAFQLEWIWDDDQYVTENALIRNWEELYRIWFEPSASPQYYPTVFSVLWLQFQFFGLNPIVFHATNVILHAITALLVYRIVSDLKLPWPFWIALAFAVHPMQVESVAWVTELKNVLSGLFYACAWIVLWPTVSLEGEQTVASAGKKRETTWNLSTQAAILLGLLLFALALLSKSVTASLPAGMLVALWFKYGKLPQRSLAILLPMLLVGAAMGWNTARIERLHVGAEGADWSYGFLDRIGIAAHCLVHYAWQLVLPFEQVFFYKRFATSFWDPANLFCASLCGALIVAFGFLARAGNRGPLAACLFFAGSAFPALAAFGLGTLASEQSDWSTAETWFQKALELKPTDLDSQYNRAYALLRLGRNREADDLCIAMIRSNPRDREVLALRKQIGIVSSERSQ